MTSSNENIFHVTGPLCVEFIGYRWFPSQRPVTRSFGVLSDLHLTGGHRTRVAAVTLDNMAERVSAQREDLP